MSHLPTPSLPSDQRFETRAPESFIDESALAPLIAGVVLPWEDRSYEGEDFAGRDDLRQHTHRAAFPTPALEASASKVSDDASACAEPLIIAAHKTPRFALLRKTSYWLAVMFLLVYIALCLITATRPDLLDSAPSWLPLELFPFAP